MRGLDHPVQEIVEAIRLEAARKVERIGARKSLDAGQLSGLAARERASASASRTASTSS